MLTNPPNLLTGARILAVPAMVAAFWLPGGFGKLVPAPSSRSPR